MIGLGSSNLGIGIAVHLRNHFSNQATRIAGSMRKLNQESNKLVGNNLVAMRNLSAGTAAAGYLLTRAMGGMISKSADFSKQLKFIQTISGASGREMLNLKGQIFQVGEAYGYKAPEIADAVKDLVKAGLSLKDINKGLTPTVQLARMGDIPLANSAEMLVNMMANFNLGADQFGMAANTLSVAANSATVDVKDLYEAVKYAGPELKNLGLTFQESMALLSIEGQAGLKGSIGGTSLGNLLRYLPKAVGQFASQRQTDALKTLGLSRKDIVDENGNLKNLLSLLARFKAVTAGMGTADKVNILDAIFGVRGVRGIMPLVEMLDDAKMGKSLTKLNDVLGNIKSNYGNVTSAKIQDNLRGDIDKLVTSWENLQLDLMGDKNGFLRSFVKGLTRVVQLSHEFGKTKLGSFLFGAALVLGPALIGLGSLGLIISTIGLGLNQTTVGFGNMARAAKWAYSQMIAYALSFGAASGAGAAGGVGGLVKNSKGRWINAATGKFAKAPVLAAAGTGAASGGMFSNLGRFIPSFARLGLMLGRLGTFALRFAPVIGIITTLATLFVDWADILKFGKTVLGEFVLGLKYVVDLLRPGVDAGKEYDKGRASLYNKVWDEDRDKAVMESFRVYKKNPNLDEGMNAKMQAQFERLKLRNQQNNTTVVNVDGKKVYEAMDKRATEDLLLSDSPVR